MIKSALFVACAGVLCLGIASAAPAEPISVTAGSLVFLSGRLFQSGPISLVGTRGFSLVGLVDNGETNIGPFNQCSPCPASSTLILGGQVFGSAFVDTNVTFEGHSFLNIGSGSEDAPQVRLGIAGTIDVPELGKSSIVLTAPFTLGGSRFQSSTFVNAVPIRGSGMATLKMEPRFGFWELQGVRFDFVATPTPEPATLILVGAGFAGIAFRARRRTERSMASR